MDAIEVLTGDHDAIKALLQRLNAATRRGTKKRVQLTEQFKRAMQTHTLLENEIFYPAFKSASASKDDDRLYAVALEEHHAVGELLLPDLLETPVESERFSGRARVMAELLEHHIENEERQMFKRARKLINKRQLVALGERLEQRKVELRDAIA